MKKYLYYFTLILLVAACEKTQKIDDYPIHKGKLVANCLFSNDSVFSFDLYKSLSPLDNAPFKGLSNASAFIKVFEEGVLFDSFRYNSSKGKFISISGKKPENGKRYSFECTYPGFQKISGSDILVQPVKLADSGYSVLFSSLFNSGDTFRYGNYKVDVNLEIDGIGANEYIIAMIQLYDPYSWGSSYPHYLFELEDLNIQNESASHGNKLFISNTSGVRKMNIRVNVYSGTVFKTPRNEMKVELYTCSKATYEYLMRFEIQNENLDDPFAEPIPITNNIVNGFGIFGGLSKTVYQFIY